MTTVVQRDSGFPMIYRLAPGNVVDVSTLTRTVITLSIYGVKTDMAILDAGYYSDSNTDQLYEAGIDFITRLPEKNSKTYDDVKEICLPELMKEENLVGFNGRYVYLKRCEIKIGSEKNHIAYAYLGYDVDRANDEVHKAIEKAAERNTPLRDMHKKIKDSGLFIIISTLPFKDEEILPAYYVRQLAEQYFDIGKGISRMIPLRVHSEESVKGHLMLSHMAATVNVYIQKKMKKYYENREDILVYTVDQCTPRVLEEFNKVLKMYDVTEGPKYGFPMPDSSDNDKIGYGPIFEINIWIPRDKTVREALTEDIRHWISEYINTIKGDDNDEQDNR
jgi:transposase